MPHTASNTSITVRKETYDALEALKRQFGTSKKFESFDAVINRLLLLKLKHPESIEPEKKP